MERVSPSPTNRSAGSSCEILLFGDLSTPFLEDLNTLLHYKHIPGLQSFLNQVSLALRHELARLCAEQQEWFPRFTNLVDLVAAIEGSRGEPALRSALFCVYQVGRVFESGIQSSTKAESIVAVGVCTGSFAAAAVSTSRTPSDLVETGVQATLVAFRTGLQSLLMQQAIEASKPNDQSSSWSFVISLSESKGQEVLKRFRSETDLPTSAHPYISAVTTSTLTFSGPPSSLKRLIDSYALKSHALEITTPYHASHLYGPEDIDDIFSRGIDEKVAHLRPQISIFSLSSGCKLQSADFQELLHNAVEDTLREQVRWDKFCSQIASMGGDDMFYSHLTILPVASSASTMLSAALRKEYKECTVLVYDALSRRLDATRCRGAKGKFEDEKIAVVGFSGRYPDAASNDEFWNLLMAGKDCHRTIPADRFDWEAHYDASGKKKNTSRVKFGCFINEPGVFDARFFNLSPREAENTDPAQRLALMAAYEAMEMAGFVPDRTPSTQRDRVGVFFGVTSDDWREVNSGQDVDTYFIPGGNRAFVPGRISYCFRFSGPSVSVDTACSSSFAAISTACAHLRHGDCDSAIAGGTNVLTNPDNFAGLDRGHFLSTTGNCNPFDDGASGYCRADAVGAVVLKRLSDAVADNDPIFGVIAGAHTNHCGQTVSITRPHEGDQLALFRRILRQSHTDPQDISYVEMHGTGTQAGDAAEMRSVLGAMAWDHRRSRSKPPRPLTLGAVKANVGHAESASGVTALIKVLLMMQHNTIPPHRLDGPINRGYPSDLAARNVHIALGASRPWNREDSVDNCRRAFLNNFSAAGGNTALLLEDAPLMKEVENEENDPRSHLPVAVSARTASALSANVAALVTHLQLHPTISLPALSYTTTARRQHHPFRVLVSGSDTTTIGTALARYVTGDQTLDRRRRTNGPPRVVFVFAGQGALYAGLGRHLFNHVASFRQDLCRFDRIARLQGLPSFVAFVATLDVDSDQSDCNPAVAHLALTCVQMALANLWTLWSGAPVAVLGHSLGEYAAMYVAGILSAADTIHLVGRRAQLLTQKCGLSTHSMLAVKASLDSVKSAVSLGSCTVACINSPSNTVLSGSNLAVQQLADKLRSQEIDAVPLSMPFAFHSPQMDSILPELSLLASTAQFNAPTIPFLSPLLSSVVTTADIITAPYIVRATREPVNFMQALQKAHSSDVINDSAVWLEICAHPTCSGMIKQTLGPQTKTLATLRRNGDGWKVACDALEALYECGADIQWNEYHRGFTSAQTLVPLPAYQWDLKKYWIQYRQNFCLTKGDEPAKASISNNVTSPATPLLSSSVHRVLEQHHSSTRSELLTESDIHDPRMSPVILGHRVNDTILCPSSLYADMAFTVAKTLLESSGRFNLHLGLDCGSMSVQRPLVFQPELKSQLLRVAAKVNWGDSFITLRFFSVGSAKEPVLDHATCVVRLTSSQSWLADWKRTTWLINSRISHLREAVDRGTAHKLHRGMVYKLFGSLVEYSPIYQGMESVVLASDGLEATAEVRLQVGSEGFDWHPCWIDSLGHIAGFIMNGTDHADSKDMVFINHGWDAMRCAKPIEQGKAYTTYNRMHLDAGTMYIGDTYILEDETVIAVFEGVRFQGIRRTVLDHLLPKQTRSSAKSDGIRQPMRTAIAKKIVPTPSTLDREAPEKTQLLIDHNQSGEKDYLNKAAEVLRIIALEAQLSPDELDLDLTFADVGIDSLLSLTISGRLQEELGVEISSADFMQYPTARSLMDSLSGKNVLVKTQTSSTVPISSGLSTPSSPSSEDAESYSTVASSVTDEASDIMCIVREVISNETGTGADEISEDSSLTELGIDSLLGLTLLGTLAERLQTSLPPGLIAKSETIGDIETGLRSAGLLSNSPLASEPTESEVSSPQVPETSNDTPLPSHKAVIGVKTTPQASSVLLQGSRAAATKTLFLFPDGAGSATSYMFVPAISSSVLVYGLNCPWLKTPTAMPTSLRTYVQPFIREIRRHQPSGPYILGGASAGGILAYEAACQLANAGQIVERLVLVDTPDPVGLENPNQRMYDFLDSMGMFAQGTSKKAPAWLRPHFDAFLTVLDNYDVQPFPGVKKTRCSTSSKPPSLPSGLQTSIIYARDGMCKHLPAGSPQLILRPDDPREMRWLINNRTDFSGGGWNSLVGSENLKINIVDDANHYTILQPGEGVQTLAVIQRPSNLQVNSTHILNYRNTSLSISSMHFSMSFAFVQGLLFTGSVMGNSSLKAPNTSGLSNYEQIQQKINLYGVIVDMKDWNRFDELFTQDVRTTSVNGNFSGFDPVKQNIIQFIQRFDSQHLIGTTQIDIAHDCNSANVYSYAHATVWAHPQQTPGQVVYLSAAYTDHFVKTAHGWRISLRHFADAGPAAGNLTILS
ncbi:Hypothetical protein R9X50_00414600 [Acrodontium crateriforme]|uniref:Polyketide synthase n=1 Tax=Acrodontium crateriforme TaxID=150365 RepID=A0AAQ3MAH8_9PEZI|nr:Hypothetical protein R9X50_00414600 [Acrodontium crateriforme]